MDFDPGHEGRDDEQGARDDHQDDAGQQFAGSWQKDNLRLVGRGGGLFDLDKWDVRNTTSYREEAGKNPCRSCDSGRALRCRSRRLVPAPGRARFLWRWRAASVKPPCGGVAFPMHLLRHRPGDDPATSVCHRVNTCRFLSPFSAPQCGQFIDTPPLLPFVLPYYIPAARQSGRGPALVQRFRARGSGV